MKPHFIKFQDDLQFEKVSSFDGTMAYAQNKRQQVTNKQIYSLNLFPIYEQLKARCHFSKFSILMHSQFSFVFFFKQHITIIVNRFALKKKIFGGTSQSVFFQLRRILWPRYRRNLTFTKPRLDNIVISYFENFVRLL